jgi:hypothetical protein
MSLRGSLDSFALPDVLALLASTAKDGELHVTGGASDGRVWLEGGRIVAADTGTSTDVVDVLVGLLRQEAGEFAFHADERAPRPGSPVEVAAVLEQAGARVGEWQEVEGVLPSETAVLTLVPEAPGAVRLSKDQWAAVVAVGEGRSVDELVGDLGGDELTQWRLLAGLVEAGLAEVGEAVQSLVSPVRRTELAQQLSSLDVQAITDAVEAQTVADESVNEDALAEDDETDEETLESAASPVPAAAKAASTDDPSDAVSRGTLLKFLSSVRS